MDCVHKVFVDDPLNLGSENLHKIPSQILKIFTKTGDNLPNQEEQKFTHKLRISRQIFVRSMFGGPSELTPG